MRITTKLIPFIFSILMVERLSEAQYQRCLCYSAIYHHNKITYLTNYKFPLSSAFPLFPSAFLSLSFFNTLQHKWHHRITYLQKNYSMFALIKNTELVEQACQHFVQSHPCLYSFPREIIPLTSRHANLRLEEEEVTTRVQVAGKEVENQVRLHLIANSKNGQNCILYLHGLASYCLQGKFLIPYLANSFSLCLFDSRSHGKNQAPYVTYGLLESQQLVEILRVLVKRGFKRIVLWGRSMGAVACLRAIQEYAEDAVMKHVRYVVADSPFASFKMIATEQICKMASLPQFLSGLLATAFASSIQQRYGLDLSSISLQKFNSKVPVTFFYSSNDEMMGVQHIETVTQSYTGAKDVCDIKILHNQERPAWVILRAMGRIYLALREGKPAKEQPKKRGLSIAKFNSQKFLSIVTPSNIDINMRKSMRIVPQLSKIQKTHRHSEYRQHFKQNSTIQPPSKPLIDRMLKRSCILPETGISASIIKLGTPSSKSRKNASHNYF